MTIVCTGALSFINSLFQLKTFVKIFIPVIPGQRGPIPLTIKTLEAESKRKTLLAEAAAAAAGKTFLIMGYGLST